MRTGAPVGTHYEKPIPDASSSHGASVAWGECCHLVHLPGSLELGPDLVLLVFYRER